MKNLFFLFVIILAGNFFCYGKNVESKKGQMVSNPYSQENLARNITGRNYYRDIYIDLDGNPFYIEDYVIPKNIISQKTYIIDKKNQSEIELNLAKAKEEAVKKEAMEIEAISLVVALIVGMIVLFSSVSLTNFIFSRSKKIFGK